MGYTWGEYTLMFKAETGDTVKNYGKYLDIWKKMDDGSWKVSLDMGNKSPDKK